MNKKIIVFVLILIVIIIGVILFIQTGGNSKNKDEKNTKEESTGLNLSTFKGVWQFPDSTYPDQELTVKNITSTSVEFDYIIDGITSFENATATVTGNKASFDIKNEGDWSIKGDIIFDANSVIFNIKESSVEYISAGSTTFTVKSDKSAF